MADFKLTPDQREKAAQRIREALSLAEAEAAAGDDPNAVAYLWQDYVSLTDVRILADADA